MEDSETVKSLSQKTAQELRDIVRAAKKELQELRLRLKPGSQNPGGQARVLRKRIARAMTLLASKSN